jgi:hypothetical protein
MRSHTAVVSVSGPVECRPASQTSFFMGRPIGDSVPSRAAILEEAGDGRLSAASFGLC